MLRVGWVVCGVAMALADMELLADHIVS